MVIAARAMEKAGIELPEADESVLTDFADAKDISGYAKDAVIALVGNAIVNGSGGRINPKASATRAEAAVIIHRILSLNKD